jgi:integrase
MAMSNRKITKRAVDADAFKCGDGKDRTFLWDNEVRGFGAVAFASGQKTYVVQYRIGKQTRRLTIGKHGSPWTAETARARAKEILIAVKDGRDPMEERRKDREAPTFAEVAEAFMEAYKRQIETGDKKATTFKAYRITLDEHILPEIGARRMADVSDANVKRLHRGLAAKKYTANKALALISSVWNWAAEEKLGVAKANNPAADVKPYKTEGRERYLTTDELSRLGDALREAETVGLMWTVDETGPKAKHAPKIENRRRKVDDYAVAAIRLLVLTGARLREILHCRWEYIDAERHMIRLLTSKTGKKTIYLSAAAEAVLASVKRIKGNPYVFPGDKEGKPRVDLNKPWRAVRKAAVLDGVRVHDLRHSFASFGAGASLGLPIIGKLLGHAQAATTQRYAHLDMDPMRRAVETIGNTIAAAMAGERAKNVVPLSKRLPQ